MSGPAVPSLETLFGAAPLCDCEDCLSAVSPCAYLVDLLDAVLKSAVSVAGKPELNGLDVLKAWPSAGGPAAATVPRRPDVLKLLLTCDNANIRVPLPDLVNECLEHAIAPGELPTSTVGTESEIAANPQYINEKVYDAGVAGNNVARALYPWTLPFDLWTVEARTYLEQLGVTHHELMIALRQRPAGEKLGEHDEKVLTDEAIVAASLALTPIERDIICGVTPDAEGPFLCWGFDVTAKGSWVDTLKGLTLRKDDGVPFNNFLGRAGIEYEDLLDLLPTRLLNPGGAQDPNRVDFDSASCDLTATRLTNLSAAWLGTLHRVVRLARKLKWTFLELDQVATALDGAKLDKAFLVRISHVQQLRKRFDLPLDEMLTWWSTLDTRGDREGKNSLYERVFLNKAIQRAFPGQSGQFDLAAPAGNELKTTNAASMPPKVMPAIAAAVGITAAELALLRARGEVPNTFDLKTLSRVYGIASFARTLKIGIQDYLSLRSLLSDPAQATHFDPFDPAHTEQTIEFIDEVERIRRGGFKSFELDYLLRGTTTPLGGLVPSGDRIVAVLMAIRDGFRTIDAQLPGPVDPEGDATRSIVTRYLDPTEVEGAMAIIGGSSKEKDTERKQFIEKRFALLGETAPSQLANALVPGAPLPSQRFAACLAILLPYDQRQKRTSLVLDLLKAAFAVDPLTRKLDPGVIEKLWTGGETGSGAVVSSADAKRAAFTDFFAEGAEFTAWSGGLDAMAAASSPAGQDLPQLVNALVAAGGPAANFTLLLTQLQNVVLVRKVAICLDRLGATNEEIPWILKDGVRAGWPGWLDPENLRGSKPSYEAFRRLLDLCSIRKTLPAGTAFGVISRIDAKFALNDILQFVSERTRWTVDDLFAVASADVANLVANEWADERGLSRLVRAMTAVRRLGVPMSQVLPWRQSPLMAEHSKAIKHALKARTGDDGWLARTKPLQDALREQRRDALVSFLVGNSGFNGLPPFRDANALFDYFLIDTQMSSCLTISRVSQAIAAGQLLIQRCLMGFEKYPDGGTGAAVLISPDAADWWARMRNFQLWAAARLVFLYPGNYLHGELRYNKSPIFRNVADQLFQGEMNIHLAEQAYRSYLEQLHEISRLEIVSLHQQPAADNKPSVLHVLGRTFTLPHQYYYRTRTDQPDGPEWSTWERASIDLRGDHVLLMVVNREPHVFWPIFSEKGEPADPSDSTSPPDKYFEIEMAYSVYRGGKWSPKALSVGRPLRTSFEDPPAATSEFLFKAWLDGSGIVIQCIHWRGDDRRVAGKFRVSCGAALKSNVPDATTKVESQNLIATTYVEEPPTLTCPDGTVPTNQGFLAEQSGTVLSLPVEGDPIQELVLTAPSRYSLVYPSVPGDFLFDQEFFYQDDKRTFLVTPVVSPPVSWAGADLTPAVLLDPRLAQATIVHRPPAFRTPLDRIKAP